MMTFGIFVLLVGLLIACGTVYSIKKEFIDEYRYFKYVKHKKYDALDYFSIIFLLFCRYALPVGLFIFFTYSGITICSHAFQYYFG
jgi:hypothetical protein